MNKMVSCLFLFLLGACASSPKCEYPEYKLQKEMIGIVYTETHKTEKFVEYYHQVKPDVSLAPYPETYPDNVEIFWSKQRRPDNTMLAVLIAQECVVGSMVINEKELDKIINSDNIVMK